MYWFQLLQLYVLYILIYGTRTWHHKEIGRIIGKTLLFHPTAISLILFHPPHVFRMDKSGSSLIFWNWKCTFKGCDLQEIIWELQVSSVHFKVTKDDYHLSPIIHTRTTPIFKVMKSNTISYNYLHIVNSGY
jgi:hypothetical protein